jgi:hypothetical protein
MTKRKLLLLDTLLPNLGPTISRELDIEAKYISALIEI